MGIEELKACYAIAWEQTLISSEITDEMAEFVDESGVKPTYRAGTKVGRYTLKNDIDVSQAFLSKVAEMGDTKPMFVTLAVPSGFSRKLVSSDNPANEPRHRFWKPEVIDSLVSKVNEMGKQGSGLPGYRGHPVSDADVKSLPNPAVLWVAASSAFDSVNSGKHAGILRGYVYDVDNNRAYIQTGAFKNGSVMGVVKQTPGLENGEPVYTVEEANIFSVDLVRTGTEGIRGTETISVEGANMKLTAEQMALLANLTPEDIREFAPALAAKMSGESGKLATESVALVEKLQKQTEKVAEFAIGNAIATEVASNLGCEIGDLPKLVTELKEIRKQAIAIAIEQSVAGIKIEPEQKFVKKQLEKATFKDASEIKAAVEIAQQEYKTLLADLGYEVGAINENESKGGKLTIASPEMAAKLRKGGTN